LFIYLYLYILAKPVPFKCVEIKAGRVRLKEEVR
jgi:hypothetical protein